MKIVPHLRKFGSHDS